MERAVIGHPEGPKAQLALLEQVRPNGDDIDIAGIVESERHLGWLLAGFDAWRFPDFPVIAWEIRADSGRAVAYRRFLWVARLFYETQGHAQAIDAVIAALDQEPWVREVHIMQPADVRAEREMEAAGGRTFLEPEDMPNAQV